MSKYRASIVKEKMESDLASKVYRWQQGKKSGDQKKTLETAQQVATIAAELVKVYEELGAE